LRPASLLGRTPLRILLHDYAGHPFQAQLSRELARRGHEVLHTHFKELQTPKGDLRPRDGDPPTFAVSDISLGAPFAKDSLLRRWRQEHLYGRQLVGAVHSFAPDVVLSANAPLEVQRMLQAACCKRGIRFVPWIQDFYSIAVETLLGRKVNRALGLVVGRYYRWLEKSILTECDQAVYITSDFVDHTACWNLDDRKCHVVENWAPLDEIQPRPRDNPWAQRHGLLDKICLLYSGTLGHKHHPGVLLALAEAFRDDEGVAIMCVAVGPGRAWLAAQCEARRLSNLIIMDLQPYSDLPDVLATGDVLIALLDREAGSFAVPSKVLSYLCAERPILLAVPSENLAARTVERASAGLVIDPDDVDGFVAAARRLLGDPALRENLASNGRRYAEATFDVRAIADRFEHILVAAASAHVAGPGARELVTCGFEAVGDL
jgi:colanic acid biosynthesis glycosyl transferase WcaI